jgi:penicillin amidase
LVIDAAIAPLIAPVVARYPDFHLRRSTEAAAWKLVSERPAGLLDPKFASWDDLLLDCARRLSIELGKQPGGLAARTWGERNTAEIRHPLSPALPRFLSRWLDMPADPLPGGDDMPRIAWPNFGASERFDIMPGHEDQSIMEMPGGQSDHPLSPFHGAGHEDWVQGRPTPLLPGPAVYTLELAPG